MVSIPACHAGDRSSILRLGVLFFYIMYTLRVSSPKIIGIGNPWSYIIIINIINKLNLIYIYLNILFFF